MEMKRQRPACHYLLLVSLFLSASYARVLCVKPISQLRFDCDTTTTRLRRKTDMFIFCSRRVEWKQARAIHRSRIVVVSQSNRNFDHFRRSRMRRGIVVS